MIQLANHQQMNARVYSQKENALFTFQKKKAFNRFCFIKFRLISTYLTHLPTVIGRCSKWMKESLARSSLIVSLFFSCVSFLLSLFALNYSKWKTVELKSNFHSPIVGDHHPLDPLIRGEVEKYVEILYRRGTVSIESLYFWTKWNVDLILGESHSFGLTTHCLQAGPCGMNLLPTFDELHYSLCHSIHAYHQCIYSSHSMVNHDGKCRCEIPSYANIIHTLLLISIFLESILSLVNLLRLCRQRFNRLCCNDIQLRLISMVSGLFSFLFLLAILIQHQSHRFDEPLEFFESMRHHYSRIQIYSFSKDLDIVLRQIEETLQVKLGASYFYVLFSFLFIIFAMLTSITIEIKTPSSSSSLTFQDDFEENNVHPQTLPETSFNSMTSERFVPSEQIRYTRQTKV